MCDPEQNHDINHNCDVVLLSHHSFSNTRSAFYLKIIIGDRVNKKHIAYVITSHRDHNVNERENWVMKIGEAMALFILKHNFLKNMTVRKE